MKKILFPTDFSETAENAFIYALKLADRMKATITTLHCYEMPNLKNAHLPYSIQEVYDSINLEEFENYRDSIPQLHDIAAKNGLDHVPVNHALIEGDTVAATIRFARKEEADLIVMGTTGASGLREIFLGSVAAEVMENAPCPVLAVPVNANFDGHLDKIAITTSFQEDEKDALQWLMNWSKSFKPDIYCVHIDLKHTEDISHHMDIFKKEFAGKPKLHFEVIDSTNMEASLANFLDNEQIDVLTMVIHQRNFFKELFSYSITKKMSYHLDQPILAIQAKTISSWKMEKKVREVDMT